MGLPFSLVIQKWPTGLWSTIATCNSKTSPKPEPESWNPEDHKTLICKKLFFLSLASIIRSSSCRQESMSTFRSLPPHPTSCSLRIKEKKVWSRTASRGKEVFCFSLTVNLPRRKIKTSAHLSPWPPHTFLLICWALKGATKIIIHL